MASLREDDCALQFAPAQAAKVPRRRAGLRARRPVRLVALLLASSVALAGGCRQIHRALAARPNILVISIDTLRFDHLGANGYAVSPSPTPWIDRLISQGVSFTHTASSAPETSPALATLNTGVYQDRHGVMSNRASLVDDNHTLAERLKEAGYATAAFVGNALVDTAHGFGQGFDSFQVVTTDPTFATPVDDKLVALFGDFLRASPRPSPWFAWVHMMDPHGPYRSAAPWWSHDFDYSRAPVARDDTPPVSQSNFGLGVLPRYQKLDVEKRLSEYVRRYDGEIRFTDAQVGALLSMLSAMGVQDDTLVVLVADHGESLVEHDELLQHGWFLYETTVHVPLVMWWPGRISGGSAVASETCTVDIVPTILDLAGVSAEGGDFDGRSLWDESPATGAVSPLPQAVAELRDAGCFTIGPRANHVISLRTSRHKLILTPPSTPRDPLAPRGTVTTDPESIELYDLEKDPGEVRDLATTETDVVERMQPHLTRLRARLRAAGWRR
ncbi:MAG: sulfatase [Deltaproteobacteria bacterium]|nr:sulfatase [Deltaproteobacteria bacterium]